MSNKIFNKFKEPKSTEFSKKDLVVDVKNGHLYYKSDKGVHKLIGDNLITPIIESGRVWTDFGTYISYTPGSETSPIIKIGTNLTPSTQGSFPEVIIDGHLAIRNTDCRVELDDTTGDKFRIQNQNGRFKIIQHSDSINDNDILAISGSKVGIGTETPNKRLHIRNSGLLIDGGSSVDGAGFTERFIIDTGVSTSHTFLKFKNDNGDQLTVTGAGNVSTNGTGSFGHLIIDYDALPTSDPNVKGQVYRNGSNQLFVSAGS